MGKPLQGKFFRKISGIADIAVAEWRFLDKGD